MMMLSPRHKFYSLLITVILTSIWLVLPNFLSDEQLKKMPGFFSESRVVLGLDLQGGSHLLLEVDVDEVLKEILANQTDAWRKSMREAGISYSDLSNDGDKKIGFMLRDMGQKKALQEIYDKEFAQDSQMTIAADGRVENVFRPEFIESRRKYAIEQSIEVVRRRVDETGTNEPTIQQQGEDRILVQLPGEGNPERLKNLLGKTAKLTFHLVDDTASVEDARRGRLPASSQLLPADDRERGYATDYVVKRQAILTGDMLVDAQPTYQDNHPVITFRFDSIGARKFGDVTRDNVGKPFAIVLDGKVISAPVIREPILGGSGVISGSFTTESARDLAILLRAGSLPAPLVILEERSVGAELGRDSVEDGMNASMIGFALVSLCMIWCYSLFGFFAVIALTLNVILLMGVLSLLGAALTLPGIAGIVLSIGMAVDANVLIFERIREELRLGKTARMAIDSGFKHATGTILDANLTALIANLFLYMYGTGPVRGFAITLSIGLIASMFTAITLTRMMVWFWFNNKKPQKLPI